jgi:hypothetical protein
MPPGALPGLIAITGRADSCLILCGTNITEAMFDQAVHTPDLASMLTGVYQVRLVIENGHQRLRLTLECRPEQAADSHLIDMIYPKLIEALGVAQPEFKDDWSSIYQKWDGDIDHRILKLELLPWPSLSRGLEGKIKQRGIIA